MEKFQYFNPVNENGKNKKAFDSDLLEAIWSVEILSSRPKKMARMADSAILAIFFN
jgi:hypothetical protein